MVQFYFQYLKGQQQPLLINAVVSIQVKIHNSSRSKSQRQFASCHMENVIKSRSRYPASLNFVEDFSALF